MHYNFLTTKITKYFHKGHKALKYRFLSLCTRPTGLPDCVVQAGVSRAGFVPSLCTLRLKKTSSTAQQGGKDGLCG